jgi:hypothetical protein
MAPARAREAAHNSRAPRRRDVPGRCQVRQRIHCAKDARDSLSGPKASVAAAHGSDSCRTDQGGQAIFVRIRRLTRRPPMFVLCSYNGCRQCISPRAARRHPRQSAAPADRLLSCRRLPCTPVQRRAHLCRGRACNILRTGQHRGSGVAPDAVLRRLRRPRRGCLAGDRAVPQCPRQTPTGAALGTRSTGIAAQLEDRETQPSDCRAADVTSRNPRAPHQGKTLQA